MAWSSKGTSGRVMRQLSSLAMGNVVEQKARERRQFTYLRHTCRDRSGGDPQPQRRNSRKTGGERSVCKKQPTWLTPFPGYIKAFVSRGLNSCY